ncbi:hypothetical protein DFH08DRAFT_827499 [Mycena albidolilacea]|uniref:Uncharacterized protein n=1 Tax=Mycena albidolilacea TaxID=1033008 RepID=A0AAD6YY37_9AGAR|nr:hypothetical protein DFH08DRAFT_827499 [Mycena albidolilacea]
MTEGGSIVASFTIYAPGPAQSSPEIFSAVPVPGTVLVLGPLAEMCSSTGPRLEPTQRPIKGNGTLTNSWRARYAPDVAGVEQPQPLGIYVEIHGQCLLESRLVARHACYSVSAAGRHLPSSLSPLARALLLSPAPHPHADTTNGKLRSESPALTSGRQRNRARNRKFEHYCGLESDALNRTYARETPPISWIMKLEGSSDGLDSSKFLIAADRDRTVYGMAPPSGLKLLYFITTAFSFATEQLPCAQPLPDGTQLLPPTAQLHLIYFMMPFGGAIASCIPLFFPPLLICRACFPVPFGYPRHSSTIALR